MKILLLIFVTVIGYMVVAVVCTIPVWLLWNWLVPEIFGLPKIGLLQALGLSLLCSMLFKGESSGGEK